MKNSDRLYNQLYMFIDYELTRREEEVINSIDNLGRSTLEKCSSADLFDVVSAKVKYDYFHSWCRGLLDYLKYFDE
jgi:hypothetical protein